jgi:hypothetical protein
MITKLATADHGKRNPTNPQTTAFDVSLAAAAIINRHKERQTPRVCKSQHATHKVNA